MTEHSHDLHEYFHFVSYALDFVLIAAGFWMAQTARRMQMKGTVGSTLKQVSAGAVVLGFAHLIETVLFEVFGVGVEANELIHRVIILVGFLFIANGLRQFAQSLRSMLKVKAPQ
ncbi:hypothetical protein [uncultured Hydrogenophaga sp.]|uniref:hypothetical protein n=1 Tax=uncultured Hydrogenophaga sp. TaxID=199683 RepID=UPI00265ED0A7|nr:hypothetical protein [uncultured Hydrogenophaga sp.]